MIVSLLIIFIFSATAASPVANNTAANATIEQVDKFFKLIMRQVDAIEEAEVTDYSYTRLIFIILILLCVLLIKTKMYKISDCFKNRRRRKPEDAITIQEMNVCVNR